MSTGTIGLLETYFLEFPSTALLSGILSPKKPLSRAFGRFLTCLWYAGRVDVITRLIFDNYLWCTAKFATNSNNASNAAAEETFSETVLVWALAILLSKQRFAQQKNLNGWVCSIFRHLEAPSLYSGILEILLRIRAIARMMKHHHAQRTLLKRSLWIKRVFYRAAPQYNATGCLTMYTFAWQGMFPLCLHMLHQCSTIQSVS